MNSNITVINSANSNGGGVGGGGGNGGVQVKCVLLGAAGVGKTCLVDRFLHDRFQIDQKSTVGAAFGSKSMPVGDGGGGGGDRGDDDDGSTVTLGVWDTAGAERFEAMTKHYYHNAAAAAVCYDLTDASSYARARKWVTEVINTIDGDDIIIVLVGTKSDLLINGAVAAERAVPRTDIDQYAQSIGARVFETSSQQGRNCNQPFDYIARTWYSKHQKQQEQKQRQKGGSRVMLSLDTIPPPQRRRVRCKCG